MPEAPAAEVAPPPVPAEVDYSTGGVFDPGEESGELKPRAQRVTDVPPQPPIVPTRPAPTPPPPPSPPSSGERE